ncbi:Cell division cycle protein 20 like [Pseudolycoriella hygida]|uniref:Cell division cycle protein 20 like n=1 Tax=Pseudolycoriella hygida TaxID=35572 RepID=A0A9Q0NDI2_9DIPT|nr:Cell division cycle protein 20 like [Pseudolycoriella hygida]
MDGDLTVNCPAPRWQKKLETSNTSLLGGNVNNSKLSMSYNNSFSALAASLSGRTPQKSGKSPGRKTTTPNAVKTPSGGDRFIPNRSTTNFDLGHYKIKMERLSLKDDNAKDTNNMSDMQKLITENLHGGDIASRKIFSYQDKAPAAPEFHQNPLRVVYNVKTPMSTKSGSRYIPSSPERILDAPEIINDYYLNLLDWSNDNIVTVALGSIVYLWNAGTGSTEQLRTYAERDHACSLSWSREGGTILAIGDNEGNVELWDCEAKKRLRVMNGHVSRVGALAWNSYIVTSGSRDSTIVHHDVRQRDHIVSTLSGHTEEVCGLKWSPDNKYLASGGNDNLVNIWPSTTSSTTPIEPVKILNQHQAAVRALAWCPWQSNLLATGGGTADRCIKFWNINNGSIMNSVDTKSQVCALLWSKNYKELISAHGYANNQLTIWKYPSMVKQAELTGHTSRVLQVAMSPDGTTVISAAADETLRLWKCFIPDPKQVKKEKAAASTWSKTTVGLRQGIR